MRLGVTLLLATLVVGQKPRPKPDREAQKEFADCLLSGREEGKCRQVLGETAGEQRDVVEERFQAEKGAPSALADQLKNCSKGDDGDTDAEKREFFEECKKSAQESLQRLRGEDVKPEEFERELEKAAEEAARQVIRKCMETATTEAAKEACFNLEEAKSEMAAISGRDASSFKADDMREAMREGARSEITEEVANCRANAADAAAARECMKPSDEMRTQVANSRGKASSEIKDSEVREFLEEGAEDEMWSIMKSCKGNREECMEAAKGKLGEATGEDFSDDMVKRKLDDAMKDDLAKSMQACMKTAGEDEAAIMSCRETLAGEMLSKADNKTSHSKGDKKLALKDAGKSAAKDVTKDCTESRETCMERLREKAAESMGRRPEELTDMELERLNKDGSKDAAKDALKSCNSAKKDDSTATCEDFMSVYEQGRGKGTMTAEEKRSVKQEMAEEMEKDDMMLCMKEESRAKYTECLENLKESDELQEELFKDLPEKTKEAKKNRAKKDAAVDAVGEVFQACMEEAILESEKEACKEEMKAKKELAGLTEDVDDVVMKYQRGKVATSVLACEASKRSECVTQAREEMVKMGMKRRAFGVVKRLADLNEAAETYAECQEETSDSTACLTLAKEALKEISGTTEVDDETAAKIQSLGEALMEGREILVRKLKQLLVEAISTASECSDAFLDKVIARVMKIASNFTVPGTEEPRDVMNKSCRVAFGKARYSCRVKAEDMDESEMEGLSDDVSEELTTADLTVRRLRMLQAEDVTETYADQEVEETAADGSSTSSSSTSESTSSSTSTEESTSTTSTIPDAPTTSSTSRSEGPTSSSAYGVSLGCATLTALLALSML